MKFVGGSHSGSDAPMWVQQPPDVAVDHVWPRVTASTT
jgi:hypothetical protein